MTRMIPGHLIPTLQAHFVLTASFVWTIAAVLISGVVWLILRAREWGAAAGWTALALAGQACSLQLLQVGHEIRLQLFYGWSELLHTWRHAFLFALGAQALIVLWGAWKYYRENSGAFSLTIRLAPWIGLLVIYAYASATIAPEAAQALFAGGFAKKALMHVTKVGLGMAILLVGALNLALAAAQLPEKIWQRWVARWRGRNSARVAWLAALWVVTVSSLLAWFPLQRLPHVPDEIAYIFQAKYMAEGKLYLPLPPDAKALDCRFCMTDDDRWYAAMLAGWPMVLAAGFKLGVPWLINPLLGGLGILLAHVLLRRLYDRDVADGTVLLLAGSPWLLYLSASLMPHATSLVLMLLGLLGVERAREQGSLAGGALAGFGFGGLLHLRPLEAVAIAGVAGLWWLAAGWKKLRLAALGMTLLTGLAMTGLFLAYNKALTGDPVVVPINKFFDQTVYPGAFRVGFGKDVGNLGWTGLDALPGHGPIDVVMNTNQNLELVNVELFGWSCGSLFFVCLLLGAGRWRQDSLMWGLLVGLWAAMSAFWFSGGPDFGARYWYQMILPLAALTVRGAMDFPLPRRDAAGAASPASARVWAFVLLASVLGTVNLIPWRAADKYYHYRGTRPDIRRLAQEYNFGRSLVLVQGKSWPDYAPSMALNPPRFDPETSGTIYALDAGPESRERLRRYYADRPVWIVAGESVTGSEVKVIAGPIPPGHPLPEK